MQSDAPPSGPLPGRPRELRRRRSRIPFASLKSSLAASLIGVTTFAPVPPAYAADPPPPRPWRLGAVYTGEYLQNFRGGVERGGAYLDNLDLTLEIDAERAFGVPGLTAQAYALYNNGGSISGRYVGDTHAISNIEATEALRLYELWFDWRFGAGGARSLRVGLYDLNSEFDASEVSSLFITGTQGIGIEFAQAGLNGRSIFPVTSVAARLEWSLADEWRVRGAVLDGVPGNPDRPSATAVRLGGEDGELYVAELERNADEHRVVIGHWRFTTTFDDLAELDAAGEPRRRRGSHGTYAFVEGDLWRARQGSRRLSGAARVGFASTDVNPVRRTLRLGLVLQPNLQWVRHPGSVPGVDDACVAGLRFEVRGASH